MVEVLVLEETQRWKVSNNLRNLQVYRQTLDKG
jgi:hypothetical protein